MQWKSQNARLPKEQKPTKATFHPILIKNLSDIGRKGIFLQGSFDSWVEGLGGGSTLDL